MNRTLATYIFERTKQTEIGRKLYIWQCSKRICTENRYENKGWHEKIILANVNLMEKYIFKQLNRTLKIN